MGREPTTGERNCEGSWQSRRVESRVCGGDPSDRSIEGQLTTNHTLVDIEQVGGSSGLSSVLLSTRQVRLNLAVSFIRLAERRTKVVDVVPACQSSTVGADSGVQVDARLGHPPIVVGAVASHGVGVIPIVPARVTARVEVTILLGIENSAGVVANAVTQRHARGIEVVAHLTAILLALSCESGTINRGISACLAEVLGVAIVAQNQPNERDGYCDQ